MTVDWPTLARIPHALAVAAAAALRDLLDTPVPPAEQRARRALAGRR